MNMSGAKLVESSLDFGNNQMTLKHRSKNVWPTLQNAAQGVFTVRQHILNILQTTTNTPWDQPTTFHLHLIVEIRGCSFFHSVCRPLCNNICFATVKRWCTMIAKKNTLRFRFARMRLQPLAYQILHRQSIPVIVPKFAAPMENFLIRCYLINKICSTRNTYLPVRFFCEWHW